MSKRFRDFLARSTPRGSSPKAGLAGREAHSQTAVPLEAEGGTRGKHGFPHEEESRPPRPGGGTLFVPDGGHNGRGRRYAVVVQVFAFQGLPSCVGFTTGPPTPVARIT